MKYLSPEIAAFYANQNQKSLVRSNTSCGIFQECDFDTSKQEDYHNFLNQKHRKG
ncbi:hypothetical protein [Pseudotamlana haliotis]|uniref:hypothetical protein n=1 Tax=Pseudotamlana haliotis TaxID=2614804 RepID=UPI001784FCCC|nr:hypothetical protein [Tamlana haliotis]